MYKNIGMPEFPPKSVVILPTENQEDVLTLDIIKSVLDSNDISYNIKELEHSTQLVLKFNIYVNIYKTGTVQIQGKPSEYKENVKHVLGIK